MYWAVTGAVILFLVAPFWILDYIPLVDYGMHLAGLDIFWHYHDVPEFSLTFERPAEPIPNMAMELLGTPLLYFTGPLTVGRFCLSLYIVLFAAGCHLFTQAAHGRRSWVAPCAVFLAYNSTLLHGFINYSIGTAVFLISLAAWIRWNRKWTPSRLLIMTGLAFATYVSHLASIAALTLSIFALTVMQWISERKWNPRFAMHFLPLLPAFLTYAVVSANALERGSFTWAPALSKLAGFGAVVLTYNYTFDAALLVTIVACGTLLALTRGITVHRDLFLLALIFVVAYLALPDEGLTGSSIDKRFILPAIVLPVISCQARLSGRRWVILLFLVVGFVARTAVIQYYWCQLNRDAREMVRLFEWFPPNSKIYVLFVQPQSREMAKRQGANLHLISLATIQGRGIPNSFSGIRGQQPIVFRRPWDFPGEQRPTAYRPAYLDACLTKYTHVWACDLDTSHEEYLRRRATLLSPPSRCSVWELRPPSPVPNSAPFSPQLRH